MRVIVRVRDNLAQVERVGPPAIVLTCIARCLRFRHLRLAFALALLFGLLLSGQPTRGDIQCDIAVCTEVGSVLKCEGQEALVEGRTSGDCVRVVGIIKGFEPNLQFCTRTLFLDCPRRNQKGSAAPPFRIHP